MDCIPISRFISGQSSSLPGVERTQLVSGCRSAITYKHPQEIDSTLHEPCDWRNSNNHENLAQFQYPYLNQQLQHAISLRIAMSVSWNERGSTALATYLFQLEQTVSTIPATSTGPQWKDPMALH